jgi:hypothetical protein
MALATPFRALMGAAATANPPSTSEGAGDNSNPYAIIIDRNVFRLNPPPPPPSAEKKPTELPKVYLNGIVKIGDDVRVLFSIPPKDAKGQTTYFKLAPGEKDGVLELVRVHPDEQEVDVLVSDTAMTLSVLSNSLAATAGKGGGASSGPAAVLRGGPRAPEAAAPGGSSAIIAGRSRDSSPYGDVTVAGGGGVTTIGGGNATSLGGGSGGVSIGGGGGSAASFGGGGVSVSGGPGAQIANALFSGGGTPSQVQTANIPPAPVIPPEQQPLALAAQTVLAQQQGIPMPPLPPNIQQMMNGEEGPSGPPSLPGLPPLPGK